MIHTLIVNQAECRKCGSRIESKSVHDYVACACGAIAIDGGNEYNRYIGDPNDFVYLEAESFEYNDEYVLENTDVTVTHVHSPRLCLGRSCPVHNKSDHDWRGWKQELRLFHGTVSTFRVCEHNIAYLDPDEDRERLLKRGITKSQLRTRGLCYDCT